jgi:pilus assembly protein CpaF
MNILTDQPVRFGKRGVDQPNPSAAPSSAIAVTEAAHALPSGDSAEEVRLLCLSRIDPAAAAALPPARLANELERLVGEIATERRINLNGREQRRIADEIAHDMLGLGPLEALLVDDTIADIMVNGPNTVFIEREGKVTLANIRFRDEDHLYRVCQRIAASVGRRVDEASPLVDARLKDGSRVNIVLPPLALDGPCLSIRKFGRRPMDFERMVQSGSIALPAARMLEIAGRARLNIIISGGTGSGKTTLLNTISCLIDPSERIVTIEDAAELQLQQPHVVRLETRPNSLEGRGEITARDLVRNALRMRPDRIIVGETRGGEAFDMLQAMNTGHSGSMSTVHANSARDALTRIENMVMMGNVGLPAPAIRQQVASAVDIVIQVERQRDGRRRVTQIAEVVGMEGDIVITNDIFKLEVTVNPRDGSLVSNFKVSMHRPSFHDRLVYFDLDRAWTDALSRFTTDPGRSTGPRAA